MTNEKKVTTLVIHAPEWKVKRKGAKNFEWIMEHNMGPGYAICKSYRSKIHRGCRVVLLRKSKPQARAEGELVDLVFTQRFTPQGIKKFDVYTENLTKVDYKEERLNRFGIALIDC